MLPLINSMATEPTPTTTARWWPAAGNVGLALTIDRGPGVYPDFDDMKKLPILETNSYGGIRGTG